MRSPDLPAAVLRHLPTPCLLVDLLAVDRNIERAAAMFRDRDTKLRPHFKAHKCTTLLKRQLAAGGAVGVTCQTAAEALVLAHAGFDDILVANQVVDPIALEELADAARLSRVSVAVDDASHVRALRDLTGAQGISLEVLVELDVGIGRCGLPAGSEKLLRLIDMVSASPGLRFRGVQAYEGHIVMREDRSVRATLLRQVYAGLCAELQRIEAAGVQVDVVSGAGTGTLDLAAEAGVVTEVQAGSYVLMDATYDARDLAFETALYIVARVLSRRDRRAGVLNAGLKTTSAEYGFPRVVGCDAEVIALSDEHARIWVRSDPGPACGDVVLLVPSHVDPTVNLNDAIFAWDGGNGLERWAIDGRRVTKQDTHRTGTAP